MDIDGVRSVNDVTITQTPDSGGNLWDYTYDGTAGAMAQSGTSGYGYKYDFDGADNGLGLIIPSNPIGTPSVFELKNPHDNIKGVVL